MRYQITLIKYQLKYQTHFMNLNGKLADTCHINEDRPIKDE